MLRFQGTKAKLLARLRALPAALSGRTSSTAARPLLRALGAEALGCVREAFEEKSAGGTGSDGVSWKPLAKGTLVRKAKRAGRPIGHRRRRGLAPGQDRLWRSVYAQRLRAGDTKPQAAAYAWRLVKAGASTVGPPAPPAAPTAVGKDSGRLLDSLVPGHPENVLEPQRGAVRCGTSTPYAKYFHKDRPLWPAGLPDAWKPRLLEVMHDAMAGVIEQMLEGR